MKTKLKDPNITKVDFVGDGANPRARIMIFKDKLFDIFKATKKEGDEEFPVSAYAYAPDPDKPSTWKLPLWNSLDEKETPASVGRAIAALGKGFRGQKVQIPADDLPGVKAKVRAAWKKVHEEDDEMPVVIKKIRDAGVEIDDEDVIELFKDALTFSEIKSHKEINQELWDYVSALERSIQSIMDDNDVSDKSAVMLGSLDQFVVAIETAIPKWVTGESVEKAGKKISEGRLKRLKSMLQTLSEIIEENDEGSDKKVDKNKLPEDVKKYVEELEAKVVKFDETQGKITKLEEELAKLKEPPVDDVYKGLTPEAVKKVKELEAKNKENEEKIQKMLDEKETEKYVSIAKKYSNTPGKAEEIGAVLKSVAKVDDKAVEAIEAILKVANEALEKAKVFEEIGKGGIKGANVIEKVKNLASELVAKNAGMTKEQAEARVWIEHPELYAEYEKEFGKKVE